MLSITQVLQAAQLVGTSLGFSFSAPPGFEQDGFMKKLWSKQSYVYFAICASRSIVVQCFLSTLIEIISTGCKDQKYLPDDNIRQEGSYKGDQGEKPNSRGSQCVQINLVSKYLFDQREKKTIGQKMKFKTIRGTNTHVECIWIHRGSWLLIGVIGSSKPIEDPCVDQHHLKIKNGQEFCFTTQKLDELAGIR